jgi:putative transposase
MGGRNCRGRGFSSCSRSGSATGFPGAERYERRRGRRRIYRNGHYERDFVTRFGTVRLRIARTLEKSFLPVGLRRFQQRAEEVSLLIREAFLRGISTRQVGRVVATITGETVSAQTVSKLTRDLDEAVRQFHQARLSDDYVYLSLDGVSFRVRYFTDLTVAEGPCEAHIGRKKSFIP